jgi:uncharacterized protein (TIGR00375 family)
MKIIADLHIHSKYSRACSQDLTPANIGLWADKKGIDVIGTGDLTHPKWLNEMKSELEETKPGLYQLKDGSAKTYFMLTTEVSSIYKQGDKVRRIHNIIFAPNFEVAEKIIQTLEKAGCNLRSDGRPIIGIHSPELVKMILDVDSRCMIIPAHAWTPHFGLFGSLSGFDTVEEAFGDQAKYIKAIETGLSSDPKMNWQISALDKYTLVSNSDAHSLRKIGREANVFEIQESDLSYSAIQECITLKDPKKFLYTIEFFPEEGKYHLDGHMDCKFSCLPKDTRKCQGICPKCGKKLLVGVLNRVGVLGDREYGFVPKNAIPYKSIIPLEEVIAEAYGTGVGKKVLATYEKMIFPPFKEGLGEAINSEFEILLDLSREEITKISNSMIAEAVMRVREGRVHVEGGYDGVFGKIEIYTDEERNKVKQSNLF